MIAKKKPFIPEALQDRPKKLLARRLFVLDLWPFYTDGEIAAFLWATETAIVDDRRLLGLHRYRYDFYIRPALAA